MTDKTTAKHKTWDHTDADGAEWEYRWQHENECGGTRGWEVIEDDGEWTANPVPAAQFVYDEMYRRRKQLPYETIMRDGRECRVYMKRVEKTASESREWLYCCASGWTTDGSDDCFRRGCTYSRTEEAAQ